MTFYVCIYLSVFFGGEGGGGKIVTNSAPEQNSETQKVYAHDALINAYIQCEENEMQVRKAAKLYNIPHINLRDRLSGRIHIDTLLLNIETVIFPPILYFI